MKISLLAIAAILIFSFTIWGQNSNVSSNSNAMANKTPEPPKTKITGRVIYEDSGKPVRRGQLTLWTLVNRGDESSPYFSIEKSYWSLSVTNDEGEFVIERATPDEYYVSVEVAGVLNAENLKPLYDEIYTDKKRKLDGLLQKITVIEGVKEQNVLIVAKRGGAVSGSVNYADGDPVPTVQVELIRFGSLGQTSFARTETDDRGSYRFSSVPSGEYTIRMTELTFRKAISMWGTNDAKSSMIMFYGDTPDVSSAKKFEIIAAEEKSGLNITVPSRKTFSIQGEAIAKNGRSAVKGAEVTIQRKSERDVLDFLSLLESDRLYKVITDDQGKFVLEDLPGGTYVLTVKPAQSVLRDKESEPRRNKEKQEYAKKEIIVVVEEKNLENLVVELPTALTISGTIETEDKRPLDDVIFGIAKEKAMSEDDSYFAEPRPPNDDLRSVAKREATVFGITEGIYKPYIQEFKKDDGLYIKSATINGKDWVGAAFEINETTDNSGFRIVLAADAGTLKGKVEFDDASDLEDLFVLILPAQAKDSTRPGKSVAVKVTGEFEQKVPPGEFLVATIKLEDLMKLSRANPDDLRKSVESRSQKITIKPKETTTVTIKK